MFTWASAGLSVSRKFAAKKRTRMRAAQAQPPPVADDGPGSNLSVLLRPDAVAHSASAVEVAALRLSFPDDPRRTAGQDFQTPIVSARTRNGRGGARSKLDGLFAPSKARARTGGESEVPSGLREIGQDFCP